MSILLRAGRREPTGMARCVALSALGMFVYKELTNQTFHKKVVDAMNVLLLALKVRFYFSWYSFFVLIDYMHKLINFLYFPPLVQQQINSSTCQQYIISTL